MTAVIDRKRYSTQTATLLAGNDHWDGSNYERHGGNSFLYRTTKGAFFAAHLTRWQGERDRIEPLTIDDAVTMYEGMTERRVAYAEAFPGIEIAEA